MDYSSSSVGTKRAAIDDYAAVPTKRSSDDYSKRASDYMTSSSSSSKRGLEDYTSAGKSSRDDYKREVEIRHLPSSSSAVAGSSSYHSSSSLHKSSGGGGGSGRYDDRTSSHSYRRMDDIR